MKRKQTRKLALDKTTVRKLETPDLEKVNGGGYGFSCNRDNCGNTCAK